MTTDSCCKKQDGGCQDEEYAKARRVTFLAIAFGTVAITFCLIGFPLALRYIQMLHADSQEELDFCRARSRDMWQEVFLVQQRSQGVSVERLSKAMELLRASDADKVIDFPGLRQRRGEAYAPLAVPGQGLPVRRDEGSRERHDNDDRSRPAPAPAPATYGGACCTCHRGGDGPAGNPGADGKDGSPGQDGRPGEPGTSYTGPTSYGGRRELCSCETGPRGDDGTPGAKGPTGPAGGGTGIPGADGRPGDNGARGDAGPAGVPGKPGEKGPRGDNGGVIPGGAPAGNPGRPGADGAPGANGGPGKDGNVGRDGAIGPAGDPGPKGPNGGPGRNGNAGANGNPGAKGSCDQCPPARTSPGY